MKLTSDFDLTARNTLGLPSQAQLGGLITSDAELEELAAQARLAGLPLRIIGGGSNLVLRDRLDAVVGVMASKGREVVERGAEHVLVRAAAGEDWAEFVAWTVAEGLWGLENLASIPGTVGAAPVQNIGAYRARAGRPVPLRSRRSTPRAACGGPSRDELHFAYRNSS